MIIESEDTIMKTLVLFYSYGGNTRRIAELVQKETGADIAEIEPAVPYSTNFNAVVDKAKEEIDTGFMPEFKPLTVDISGYDKIIIGSPVWWYTLAPVVKSFLCHNDLTGKTLSLFATNEGWIGHTFKDFDDACSGATVKKGINVRFSGHSLKTSEAEIKEWAK